MDYFGEFGVMAFKSYETGKVIHYRIISNENNTDYKEGVRKLQEKGWKIKAIVCDVRKGILSGFPDIPNTTNALEGAFGHLKTKVALHRGLKKERKIKLILSLLHGKN